MASLVRELGCTNVTACVLEASQAELEEKYPDAAATNIETVTKAGGDVKYGVDVLGKGKWTIGVKTVSKPKDAGMGMGRVAMGGVGMHRDRLMVVNKVAKVKETRGEVDRIVFNFPHVGGKSKDINRQVRYNQGKRLVSFDLLAD